MLFSSFYKTGTSLSLDTMNRCDTETIRFRIMNHNLWSDSWSKLCSKNHIRVPDKFHFQGSLKIYFSPSDDI